MDFETNWGKGPVSIYIEAGRAGNTVISLSEHLVTPG